MTRSRFRPQLVRRLRRWWHRILRRKTETWRFKRQDPLTISVDEAAELVGIAPDTIRRAVSRCENIGFPVIKAGRRYVALQVPLLTVLGVNQ